jgi:chaperonin cofactor prefoldin
MSIRLLFLPLTIVILLWSVIGVTKPAWDEYQAKKGEATKLLEEKNRLSLGMANIKKALAEYNGLDNETKIYLNNAIPAEAENDNLIGEINKNASQSSVLVLKLDAKNSKARVNSKCKQASARKDGLDCSRSASVTNVTLSVAGTYPIIKDFLGKLDLQNRVIVPRTTNLITTKKVANEEVDTSKIKLITAKINFDVFQKKKLVNKKLSTIMSSDKILKSLLTSGLNQRGVEKIRQFIDSDVFIPVTVEGAGKEDLFNDGADKAEPVEVNNEG